MTDVIWDEDGLETFLRGMETPPYPKHLGVLRLPLKPSLEGWKQVLRGPVRDRDHPLKPSLEGWKRRSRKREEEPPVLLETFLRGMETALSVHAARAPWSP